MQVLVGLLLAVIISYLAYRLHSLSKDGAVAAALLGTIVYGSAGWQWAAMLLIFFASSSALSYAFKRRKQKLAEDYSKGGQRDAGQVFSNGGIAAVFALLHAVYRQESWPWLGFAAGLAAVNADTWATELGILDPNPPRLITHLTRSVSKGTSGGISFFGTFASLLGAAAIAIPAAWLSPLPSYAFETFWVITIAGWAGSLFDSLIGATLQAMYFCPADQKETEKHPIHSCGAATIHVRGWKWVNNDSVNLACGAFGVLTAFLLSLHSF